MPNKLTKYNNRNVRSYLQLQGPLMLRMQFGQDCHHTRKKGRGSWPCLGQYEPGLLPDKKKLEILKIKRN